MRPEVNAISGRLSLRPPQRRSLEILDRLTEIVSFEKDTDVAAALDVIKSEFPTVTDFERDFPSLCFALATGVGKTRLMGAFIAYLHEAHGMNNFFVLAPNLTIYNKLRADFTPNTPKYVFKGLAVFATTPPEIIDETNYGSPMTLELGRRQGRCFINIFNVGKFASELRGGRQLRMRKLTEYLGESYFDYLAALPDLVMLMDESHRYRASAAVRSINELKPVLGLEFTATPFLPSGGRGGSAETRGARFQNVIFDYRLGQAMADGFVKEPAVVTRKDFNPAGMPREELEVLKLEDGIRLHEQTKVHLETYARENGVDIVKPFVLVVARDTAHARELLDRITSDAFFEGRYKDKVIQVDSSTGGMAGEEALVQSLLNVERFDNPVEIVIHVAMLKEGWDVTNLYTIVPLNAANARILIEQTIGRGLRLPYGKRTGVDAVDRLSIVAHDRFQEIVDEASRPDSLVRLTAIELDANDLASRPRTVVAQPKITTLLGIQPPNQSETTVVSGEDEPSTFATPEEQRVAQIAYGVMQRFSTQPETAPSAIYLARPEVQELMIREVQAQYSPAQGTLEGIASEPDIARIVEATANLVIEQTIDIPRILVLPRGEVKSGFRPFELDLSGVRYQPPSQDLFLQYLRTSATETIGFVGGGLEEARPEDYVVRRLIDYDDVAYDTNSELLYDLAGQVVRHLRAYLSEEEVRRVLRYHEREIGGLVHAQMQAHYWEEAVEYDVEVRSGFSELRPTAFSQTGDVIDFRVAPTDRSNMSRYLFGGFGRCLYPVQKFQSEQERILAVILDREAQKWFKPVQGQFQLVYRSGADYREYQPDFVAETETAIYMLEPKRRSDMDDPEVIAKRDAAVLWCQRASDHARTYNGKPWAYALIPHDAIAENMSLEALATTWEVRPETGRE